MATVALARAPRILYLDVLRNCLMLLGVVVHSAQVFRVHGEDAWQLGPPSLVYDYLVAAIHIFRLPAFFLIAGYVGSSVIRTRGIGFFERRRLVRLGVPFLTTLLTLNLAEVALEATFAGTFREGFSWNLLTQYVSESLREGNLRHLWFLPTLLFYSVALAPLLWLRGRLKWDVGASRWLGLAEQSYVYLPALVLSVVVIDALTWRMIPAWQQVRWTQIPDPDLLFHYFPYFLFGMFAEKRPALWSRFGSTTSWYAVALMGMLLLVPLALSSASRIANLSRTALETLAAWALIGLVIRVGRRFLDKSVPRILASPELAYSVYLFHHIIIAGMVLLLANVSVQTQAAVGLEVATITLVTGGLSLGIARLITRVPLLRFFFNGRPIQSP